MSNLFHVSENNFLRIARQEECLLSMHIEDLSIEELRGYLERAFIELNIKGAEFDDMQEQYVVAHTDYELLHEGVDTIIDDLKSSNAVNHNAIALKLDKLLKEGSVDASR